MLSAKHFMRTRQKDIPDVSSITSIKMTILGSIDHDVVDDESRDLRDLRRGRTSLKR